MGTRYYHTVEGEIIGETALGGSRTDYLVDALGSVTGTVNQSAQVVNTYRYKPYGALLAKTGTGPDPKFQWVGSLGYRPTGRRHSDYYAEERHYSTISALFTAAALPRARMPAARQLPGLSLYQSAAPFPKGNPPFEVVPGGAPTPRGVPGRGGVILTGLLALADLIEWSVTGREGPLTGIGAEIGRACFPGTDELPPPSKEERRQAMNAWMQHNRGRRRRDREVCIVTAQHRPLNNSTVKNCKPDWICAGAFGPNCTTACTIAKGLVNSLAEPGCQAGHAKTYCPNMPSLSALARCNKPVEKEKPEPRPGPVTPPHGRPGNPYYD